MTVRRVLALTQLNLMIPIYDDLLEASTAS
jgi:hypothetical protein